MRLFDDIKRRAEAWQTDAGLNTRDSVVPGLYRLGDRGRDDILEWAGGFSRRDGA